MVAHNLAFEYHRAYILLRRDADTWMHSALIHTIAIVSHERSVNC